MKKPSLNTKLKTILESIRPLGATAVELTDAILGSSPGKLVQVFRQLYKLEENGDIIRTGPRRATYWRAK